MIPLAPLGRDELWQILVETVHSLPMYKSHKRYVGEIMIKETPQITPRELAIQLNIPQGEAIILLEEIRGGQPSQDTSNSDSEKPSKTVSDRSLLEFNK
jgi:hypothetical protein